MTLVDSLQMSTHIRVEHANNHCQLLVGKLCDLWKNEELCDVTIESKDGILFKAHRVVLSASSKALSVLFSGQYAEGKQIESGSPVHLEVPSTVLKAAFQGTLGKHSEMQW